MNKDTVCLGIDFGASNIKVVQFDGKRFRSLKINKSDTSGDETPNFLHYKHSKKNKDKNQVLKSLGSQAKTQLKFDRANVIWDIKRKLYEQDWRQHVPALNRELSADEAIEDIFTIIRDNLPFHPEAEIRAVITVPVTFTSAQIKRLRANAEKAGLKVEGVISEAFAGAFALKEQAGERLACIFDFGGSTLDVSIVHLSKDETGLEVRELAASGMRIGGLDIDRLIFYKIIMPKYEKDIDQIYENDVSASRNTVFDEVELGKKTLFGYDEEYADIFHLKGDDKNVILSKAEIIAMLESEKFRERIFAMLDHLFEQLREGHGLDVADVDAIYAYGGVMRMPFFQQIVEDYFSKDKFAAEDYDEEDVDDFIEGLPSRYMAVAGGAARYLHHLLEPDENISISNIIPFQLGYMRQDKFQLCVQKNNPAGFESPYKLLPLDWLNANGWQVPVYQCFDTPEENQPIYMQTIQLDQSKYNPNEPPLLKMRATLDGDLLIRIFQNNPDNENIDCIEEHIVQFGEE